MTNKEINERVALALGRTSWAFICSEDSNDARVILDHIDKHRPAMSVAFLNALRDVLAPRMPKNKAGSPVITDFDILMATPREICEAFLKAVEKGKK